ncbi:hypothetical protein [Methanosalsum natronophilum]|nr:hypothetical protein [Methanosalsum natronophilum]MCS3924795.1 hypothetical protein [Methanosalsum natronophilum]
MTDEKQHDDTQSGQGPKKKVTKAKINPIKVGDERGNKKKGLLDTCE